MSIGLPGSGVGGVFYLLSALYMPVHSAQRKVRGGKPKVRIALRQSVMAVLIIGALWFTGVAIEWMMAGTTSASLLEASGRDGNDVTSTFRTASFLLTFGTLAGVLMLVQVLRLFIKPRPAMVETRKRVDQKKAA